MPQTDAVIQVRNLRKVFSLPEKEPGLAGAIKSLFAPRFKQKVAVDDISFDVYPGEVVGYIGVNGAGKSTTIKMLTGILAPTSGKVRILGRDPYKSRQANARDIGVVFGQRTQLWWDLAFIESLKLIAQIYDVPPARFKTLLEEFTEVLKLDELLHKPVRAMSLGQKMRAELAATLIHEPRVVYLDEPTIGLDVVAKQRIRDFIKKECAQRQVSVLLTTHDLGDIEELCQRVIIIDQGKVLFDGLLSTIKQQFGRHRTITFETEQEVLPELIKLPPGCELLPRTGEAFRIQFDRGVTSASQVTAQIMGQVEVRDFSIQEPELSSIIADIYRGSLNFPVESVN